MYVRFACLLLCASNLQVDHIKKQTNKSLLGKTRPQAKGWPLTSNEVLYKANVKIWLLTFFPCKAMRMSCIR